MKVKNRATVNALRFRESIRSAFDVCNCTTEAIAQRCGITRQTIQYMMAGKCRMRKGTARAIVDALTAELRAEVTAERERIDMLEQLIVNINYTYNREYECEG